MTNHGCNSGCYEYKVLKRNKYKNVVYEILNVVRFFKIIFKKQIKKYYIYLDQKLNKTKTNIMAKVKTLKKHKKKNR
jgi:hypothetical protein